MAVSSADKKKLGKWIKQAREKKQPHLSQRQLALAVDITNASLSSIESGMIFPSEELLLKLIEQLQPPPELREKMLALFAKAKGTSPPDINAELSKNPKLWGLIRQLIAVDPSEEQITQIEQLIYAGISASGGTTMGVGSLGKVSLFSYDGDKPFVTDSTLRIYRAKKHTHVLPEVLCIFLQSAIGQELIYRYVVGSTGIINIYDDDIAKIPIPILDGEIQKDIAEKVQNSFALRRQSKQLLEYAKQAVEMAIEQGEDAALVWLKERSGE